MMNKKRESKLEERTTLEDDLKNILYPILNVQIRVNGMIF